MNDEYLRIGMVSKSHGVNGALKLLPLTFDNNRFSALRHTFLERDGQYVPVNVVSVNVGSESVIINIEGVNDKNAADKLRGVYICVPREEAALPPKGQYLIVDLIGCDVFDTNGKALGKLTDVYNTNANDVYEIKGECGRILVPALKKLLNTVDVVLKRIILDAQVLSEVGLFED